MGCAVALQGQLKGMVRLQCVMRQFLAECAELLSHLWETVFQFNRRRLIILVLPVPAFAFATPASIRSAPILVVSAHPALLLQSLLPLAY
mmetsp:Transcript_43016/g.122651  ORF Transcript_43016/g.122651 Transcript_43016/m.122651 type:complete len:90 (-) Transcript_43016:63-332(-)